MYYSALTDLSWEGTVRELLLHDNQKKKKVCPFCKIFFLSGRFLPILDLNGFRCTICDSRDILFWNTFLFNAQLGSYILAVDDFRLILDCLLVLVSFQAEVCHSPFSDFNFKRKSSTWLSRLFYSSSTTFSIPLGVVICVFAVIHIYRKKLNIA